MSKPSRAEKDELRAASVRDWTDWGWRVFGWRFVGWHEPDAAGNDLATFEHQNCFFILHLVQRKSIDAALVAAADR